MPEWLKVFLVTSILCGAIALGAWLSVVLWPAHAENWYDGRKSEEQRQAISKWFAMPTVAGCCKESDAFEADDFEREGDRYIAIITDGEPNEWRPGLRTGMRIPVPNDRIKWAPPNPSGHGVIFLRRGWDENNPDTIFVYCFFPPSGG